MFNKKCRICLVDGATNSIFEDIDIKGSIHSKLCMCFKEKIEDLEGYPQKICESCNDILDIVHDFIIKYKTSSKLLESGLICVKNEQYESEVEIELYKEEDEVLICKNEPDSELDHEPLNDFWVAVPEVNKSKENWSKLKAKLKCLKDINVKNKLSKKSHSKTGRVASSILEAEFDWNGESLKSSKIKPKEEPQEQKPKRRNKEKLILPKLPKVRNTPLKKLCDICGEIFKDHNKLLVHRKQKHFAKPEKCPKCSQVLSSNYELKRHLKRLHSTKDFICDTCGRGFAFKNELSTHTKVVHLRTIKKKRHPCDKCDKHFVNAKSLLIHDRSAHTGIRPAECSVCGSCFFHEDYLKEHMRLHTGETPFKCPICGRGYAQRGNLKSHISHNHRLADLSEEQKNNLRPSWFKFLKKP